MSERLPEINKKLQEAWREEKARTEGEKQFEAFMAESSQADERVLWDSSGAGRGGEGEAVRAGDPGRPTRPASELSSAMGLPDRRLRMSGIVVLIDDEDGVPRKYELDATLTEMP